MALSFRDGLSFCRVDDQIYLLDLHLGRYSRLGDSAASAFERVRRGDPMQPDDSALLASLLAASSAEPGDTTALPELFVTKPPSASLLDQQGHAAGAARVLAALNSFGWMSMRLKLRGVRHVIDLIEARKALLPPGAVLDPSRAARIAAAFIGLDLLIGRTDRCLPRSAALMMQLLAAGQSACLVIGVTGRPFNAHCWVQSNDLLLSDRLDQIHDYTPILVI